MSFLRSFQSLVYRIAPIVIGIIIVLGAIVVFPKMSHNYINSKTFLIEMGLAIVVFLGATVISLDHIKKFLSTRIVWGWGAFLGAALIATLLSVNPTLSWLSNFERGTGMFFLLVVSFGAAASVLLAKATNTVRTAILYPIALSGGIIALSTILGSSGLQATKWLILSDVSKGGGFTGNSSFAGSIIMIALFVAVYLFVTTKDTWKKWLLGLSIGFSVLSPIMFNYQMFKFGLGSVLDIIGDARGATTATGAGLLVALGIYLAYSHNKVRAWTGRLLAGGVIFLVALAIVLLAVPGSPVHKTFVQKTTSARFVYWGMSLKPLKERPLFGTGPETYRHTSERFFEPKILRPSYGEEIWADKPHNAYLEILSTTGVVGAGAYLFFIGTVIATLFALGRKKEEKVKVAVFSGLFFAYLLNNLILFDISVTYFFMFLILLWLGSETVLSDQQNTSEERGVGVGFVTRIVAGVAVVVIVWSIVIPEIKKLRLILNEIYAPIETRMSLYEKTEAASPFGAGLGFAVRADLYSQNYMNHVNEIASGPTASRDLVIKDIEMLSQALLVSMEHYPPSTQSLIALGRLAGVKIAILNQADQSALDQMSYAGSQIIKLSPKNLQGYWLLGQVEIYKQNYDKALEIFTTALNLDRSVPTSHMVIINLARLTNNKELFDKATADFERDVNVVDRQQWVNGLVGNIN